MENNEFNNKALENEMGDRLKLDYESVCTDIEHILDDIQALRNERIFSQAIGSENARKLRDHESTIKKRLSETFSLVIIGDFKRGKSSLVNAILGEDLLPAAVTPETVTINRLSYAEVPKAEAVLQNGRRASLDVSELKRDILERLLPQLPAPIDYIDVKANNEILKDISVVDTPGIGDLMNAFDEKVTEYLTNADALIYVVSARAPFSESEQAFLASSVIPQSFSQTMVVVNMADILETEEDIEKIKNLTIERARSVGDNVSVFMLSALDELCRKKGVQRPVAELETLLENNFLEFEDALTRDIILQKDIIKTMRGVSLMEILLRDISARIELVKNSIGAGIDNLSANVEDFQSQDSDLRKKIDGHKASLAADIDEMKGEAREWINEFLERLKAELQTVQGAASMQDVERHFQFYMMDTIKSAVNSCVRFHKQEISDKTSSCIQEMAQETSQQIFGEVSTAVAGCITDVSWTGVDTAAFALDFLHISGNLGLLSYVGQAIMGFVRQKKIAGRQTDFITPLLNDFNLIKVDVSESITKVYDKIKFRAVDILDEVYHKQSEASVSAIQQAKEIMLDETTKKEDVIHYLNTVLEKISDSKQSLEKYK